MASSLELSDSLLISRLRDGEISAFEAIYHRYWQKLYAIAYNRLKDQGVAEDIVHDVFAAIWQKRSDIEPNDLAGYLASSVKYAVLSYLRKKESHNKYYVAQSNVKAFDTQLEHRLHHKRILQMVHEEVEKLPEKCRLIFKYSREKGMSTQEIATLLKISDKTVENQIGKALRRLRTSFKNVFSCFSIFFL